MTFLKILGSIILGVVLAIIAGVICAGIGVEEQLMIEICIDIGITVPAVLTFYIIFFFLWENFFDDIAEKIGGVLYSITALVFFIAAVLCLAFIPIIWIAVVVFLVFFTITLATKRNSLGVISDEIDRDNSYDYDVYEVDDSGYEKNVYHGHYTSQTFFNIWWIIQAIIYIVLPLVGRFAFDDEYNWYVMLAPSIILIIGVIKSIVKRGHDNYYDNDN